MEDDLLDLKLNKDTTLKQATAIEFIQWALKKVNDSNLPATSAIIELNAMANFFPGKFMQDEQKLETLKKMQKAGIKFD